MFMYTRLYTYLSPYIPVSLLSSPLLCLSVSIFLSPCIPPKAATQTVAMREVAGDHLNVYLCMLFMLKYTAISLSDDCSSRVSHILAPTELRRRSRFRGRLAGRGQATSESVQSETTASVNTVGRRRLATGTSSSTSTGTAANTVGRRRQSTANNRNRVRVSND